DARQPTDRLGDRSRSVGVALPDRDPGAVGREAFGDPATDPRAAAGHDRDPPVEPGGVRRERHQLTPSWRTVRAAAPAAALAVDPAGDTPRAPGTTATRSSSRAASGKSAISGP